MLDYRQQAAAVTLLQCSYNHYYFGTSAVYLPISAHAPSHSAHPRAAKHM